MIPPPEHLDEQARAKWAEVYPILEGRADTQQGTLDALAAYCVAWSQWTAADTQVKALGLVVKSPNGFPVENPYLPIARKAQSELRRWGSELRLTPKSRKAAETAPGEPPQEWRPKILAYLLAETEALKDDPIVKERGVPWTAAAIANGQAIDNKTTTAISRCLQEMEADGLIVRYRPSGKTLNVKLTGRP